MATPTQRTQRGAQVITRMQAELTQFESTLRSFQTFCDHAADVFGGTVIPRAGARHTKPTPINRRGKSQTAELNERQQWVVTCLRKHGEGLKPEALRLLVADAGHKLYPRFPGPELKALKKLGMIETNKGLYQLTSSVAA